MPNPDATSDNAPSHKIVHLLSERSRLQKRDIFLFYDKPGNFKLSGGLNASRYENLTIAKFYRWMVLLDYDKHLRPFIIWPVEITKLGILSYVATRVGQPLPRNSGELMLPGDYAVYFEVDPEPPLAKQLEDFNAFPTFKKGAEMRAEDCGDEGDPFTFEKENFAPFECIVKQRDQGICCITGKFDVDAVITWVVPPTWATVCNPEKSCDVYDLIEQFRVVDNIITIDADLLEPFRENKFGIDVEDNYRVIIFEDFSHDNKLGTYLPLEFIASAQNRADLFFKGHFRWCLGVNFLGGDITLQHPDYGEDLIDDIEENRVDKDDPKWQSPFAKEILKLYGVA